MKYLNSIAFLICLTSCLFISEIFQRIVCLFNPLRQEKIVYPTSRICLFLMKVFFRVNLKVNGFDNLEDEQDGTFIITANHQSLLDIPILITVFGSRFVPRFIAKKELGRYIPCISLNLRKGGSVLIDRSNPKSSLREIKKGGEFALKNNFPLVIFPEGTRTKTGELGEFKEAGFKFLLSAYPETTNIYPVRIDGSYNLNPKGRFKFLDYGKKDIIVTIFSPYKNNNSSKLLTQIRDDIKSKK